MEFVNCKLYCKENDMSKVINVAETTMMAKVRNYIYNMHLTWEEIADIFGVSVGYLRYHKVKPYYKGKA